MNRKQLYTIISCTTAVLGILVLLFMSWAIHRERINRRIHIDVPTISWEAGNAELNRDGPIVIDISAEGELLLSQRPILIAELEAEAAALFAQTPDHRVIIRGSFDTDLTLVANVRDIITQAGFERVQFTMPD